MGIRVRLPDMAFAVLPLLLILTSPAAAPMQALDEEAGKAAALIAGRLDSLPMDAFWDSVARLEALGKDGYVMVNVA